MEKNGEKDNEVQIQYRGVKTMPLIIGNESFEKLGTIGAVHNLLVYLTTVFNMKTITATTFINVFSGTTNFATLPGAFLCDTYFGRYKTLGFASVSSLLGMLVLTLTAAITKLHPDKCDPSATCPSATPWQLAFLLGGLGLLVVGAGGIRPCNLAFGADQFNPKTESGKKGIDSFFNWYYITYTTAMMVSLTPIVYVQSEMSWSLGLAIPTVLMFFSCVCFFAGSRLYVKVAPEGSPLASAVCVVVAAARKRRLKPAQQPWVPLFNYGPGGSSINTKLPYTDQFRSLDKAAMIEPNDTMNTDGSASDPWRLCTMQQVEEVKCLARVVPIWASSIVFYVAVSQHSNFVVFQALQADRRLAGTGFSVPAASLAVFSMLGLTLWLALYDRVLVPVLRRITGEPSGITILQRMGSGMVVAVLTMVLSGLVEEKRRALALANPIGDSPSRGAVSPLSGFWFVPQLILIGISEGLTIIGHVEFYYKQFPENMRSIGGSFLFVGMGISSYMGGFLVSVVHSSGNWLDQDLNKARLDLFYYLVAAMGALNFMYFLVFARWYQYKQASSEHDQHGLEFGKTVV